MNSIDAVYLSVQSAASVVQIIDQFREHGLTQHDFELVYADKAGALSSVFVQPLYDELPVDMEDGRVKIVCKSDKQEVHILLPPRELREQLSAAIVFVEKTDTIVQSQEGQ